MEERALLSDVEAAACLDLSLEVLHERVGSGELAPCDGRSFCVMLASDNAPRDHYFFPSEVIGRLCAKKPKPPLFRDTWWARRIRQSCREHGLSYHIPPRFNKTRKRLEPDRHRITCNGFPVVLRTAEHQYPTPGYNLPVVSLMLHKEVPEGAFFVFMVRSPAVAFIRRGPLRRGLSIILPLTTPVLNGRLSNSEWLAYRDAWWVFAA